MSALSRLLIIKFIFICSVTVALLGQSQETRDAIQDADIAQVVRDTDQTTRRIEALAVTVAELTASMNRLTGIGIGLGVAFTALQGIQIVLQLRNK
jgi:hypothetical protein